MKTKKNINQKTDNDKNNQNESAFYRLIIMGDSGVGKTQIINKYNNKIFENEHLPTFGIDFQIKTLNISGKKTNIHCIDTEGSKDFSEDTGKLFIKKADCFILIYDITSRESFINLHKYYNIFKFSLNSLEKTFNKKIIYFVGNKYDLKSNRLVNESEARESANKFNAKYIECSAKNGFNVDNLFEYVLQDILKRDENNISDRGDVKNNAIFRNIMSIKSNDSLRNTNRNEFYTENESRQNFETSSNLLKTRSFNDNNDFIKNINNFQSITNKKDFSKTFYPYQNRNKLKKCEIF